MAVKQYGWKDVSLTILGRTFEGVTDIKVKRKTTKERQYGRGNQAQHILVGNEEVSGSITILQNELDAINIAIKAVNPALDITKVTVDGVINYEDGLGLAATDIVKGMSFEEYEKGLAQGDTHMKIEIPYIATGLIENI